MSCYVIVIHLPKNKTDHLLHVLNFFVQLVCLFCLLSNPLCQFLISVAPVHSVFTDILRFAIIARLLFLERRGVTNIPATAPLCVCSTVGTSHVRNYSLIQASYHSDHSEPFPDVLCKLQTCIYGLRDQIRMNRRSGSWFIMWHPIMLQLTQ